PTGSGTKLPLNRIAEDLTRRLISIFLRDEHGRRPVFGGSEIFQSDEHWRDHLLFYEYFHGDNGARIGASHQTGWTAIVANLIDQLTESAAAAQETILVGRQTNRLVGRGRDTARSNA